MSSSQDLKQALTFILIIIFTVLSILLIVFGFSAIYAEYNVWSSGLSGEAELKQAEWNRQITVREAQAKMDSARLLAQAEIERAKGVAEANKIIGNSLHDNENYLRYLWIDSLHNTQNQIVYVPTESGLPILEANRLNKK